MIKRLNSCNFEIKELNWIKVLKKTYTNSYKKIRDQ